MNDTKRSRFTRDEVQTRLSRRRFAMAATGAALVAMGNRTAWGQDSERVQCENTAKLYKDLTMTQVFGEPSKGGEFLSVILTKAINNFVDPEKKLLIEFRNRLQERDERANGPAICYRDFFATPNTKTLDEVLEVLVPDDINDSDLRGNLKTAMDKAREHFQMPMLQLPADHDPKLCARVLDGWSESGSNPPEIAGVIHAFGNDNLETILRKAPDYSRADIPWLWRAHLLRFTNLFGMTSMSNGVKTNYTYIYNRTMSDDGSKRSTTNMRGANQCAYLGTDGNWYCGSSPSDKCTLQNGQPTEGSDLCGPPPGP